MSSITNSLGRRVRRPALVQGRLLGLVLASMSVVAPASADDNFFAGKTLNFVVGVGVGGGFDTYTRMLARHMAPLVPGKPNFVVRNLPGAGTMRAVQSIQHSPTDGTYIVAFNSGAIFNSVIGTVDFDFHKVAYLGSVSAESQVCFMWHATGVRTFA